MKEKITKSVRGELFFADDFAYIMERQNLQDQGVMVEYKLPLSAKPYSQWIDHTLHIRETATTEWKQEDNFEFQIMDSPHAVEQTISDKVAEDYSGRMMAGFRWLWTK